MAKQLTELSSSGVNRVLQRTGRDGKFEEGSGSVQASAAGGFAQGFGAILADQGGTFAQGYQYITAKYLGSFAQGYNYVSASGEASFAQGHQSILAGNRASFSQGYQNVSASGVGSFAQGHSSLVAGFSGTFAQGYNEIRVGREGSFAQGYQNIIAGNWGVLAQGYQNITGSQEGAFAHGFQYIVASGEGSLSQGYHFVTASGAGSVAIGHTSVVASADGAIAIGYQNTTASAADAVQFAGGTNALSASLQIGSGPRIVDSTFQAYSTNRAGDLVLSSSGGNNRNYNFGYGGDIVFFGTGSLTANSVYYLNLDGGWEKVNANATGSRGETGAGQSAIIAIARGSAASNGMLLRGFWDIGDSLQGDWVTGSALYIHSGSTAGAMSGTAPSATSAYARICGYMTDTHGVVFFDPDKTWVEIS